jgi:small subunit ribosomal protein S13
MYVVILGIKINSHESLYKSLTSIYGIGESQSYEICNFFGLSKFCTYFFITSKKKKKLRVLLKKTIFGTQLFQKKIESIKFLKDLKTDSGFRHKKKLPVRGQRTRSNARTCRKI